MRTLTEAAQSLGAGPRLLNHFLFPDSKIGWLPFGSVAGRHIIDREKPAAIFATSPPFTALLLGVRLKAHAHAPLVLDFRDPWPTGFARPPRHQRAALRRLRRYLVEPALVLDVGGLLLADEEVGAKVDGPPPPGLGGGSGEERPGQLGEPASHQPRVAGTTHAQGQVGFRVLSLVQVGPLAFVHHRQLSVNLLALLVKFKEALKDVTAEDTDEEE